MGNYFPKLCEVCEGPAVGECSGLDVPRLCFCAKHLKHHKTECNDAKCGNARVVVWSTEAPPPHDHEED